jgi:hypothetical protein
VVGGTKGDREVKCDGEFCDLLENQWSIYASFEALGMKWILTAESVFQL